MVQISAQFAVGLDRFAQETTISPGLMISRCCHFPKYSSYSVPGSVVVEDKFSRQVLATCIEDEIIKACRLVNSETVLLTVV
jgi:hypothetical protein